VFAGTGIRKTFHFHFSEKDAIVAIQQVLLLRALLIRSPGTEICLDLTTTKQRSGHIRLSCYAKDKVRMREIFGV